MKKINKILIAEDQLLIAKVLRMQLEGAGYEVQNVVDGNEAFNTIIEWKPDLVIMDNYLKNNTNGLEVAHKVREINIETPIIFVTGNSYENTKALSSSVTRSTVFSKPVIFAQLQKFIVDLDDDFIAD
jgi:CheY-like chemotaxis protein